MPGRSGSAGFTLVEVMVVLVVLALVAGLVLARGAPRSAGLEMRAAASGVAQTMRAARTRAIASNRPVVVRFDTQAATMRVDAGPPRALPSRLAVAVLGTADVPAGIAFLPDGSSSGGRVELAGGGRRTQVGVEWLTGRVTVADGP